MNRRFKFIPDEIYHIYSRGVDRRAVFSDDSDRKYFQKLLYLCNSTKKLNVREIPRDISVFDIERPGTIVDIGAYAQMPNHIHLLLREKDFMTISKMMSKLLIAYAKYFNTKYKRTGVLFDGRFKAKHVDDDGYLAYLYGYIPLNPVKLVDPKWKENGLKNKNTTRDFLKNYPFSSYLDFMGTQRPENKILSRENFPEDFRGPASFDRFVESMFSNSPQ